MRVLTLLVAFACADVAAAGLPRLAGWKPAGKTASYDKQTIWQAIDGAAELFVAHGFRAMQEQEYGAKKRSIAVQVYELEAPLGAFGVFARERPPKAQALAVGAGGAFAAGGHCLAYKGRFYIKVITRSGGELDRRACHDVLRALTGSLPGGAGKPAELALLPARGRLAGTEGYTRRSYLGTRRLESCLHAEYGGGSKRYTLFVMLPGPKESLDAAWRRLASHWKPHGPKLIATQLPYRGAVVLMRGKRRILGAAGVGSQKATIALLEKLRER